jgi:hypothetical protein
MYSDLQKVIIVNSRYKTSNGKAILSLEFLHRVMMSWEKVKWRVIWYLQIKDSDLSCRRCIIIGRRRGKEEDSIFYFSRAMVMPIV